MTDRRPPRDPRKVHIPAPEGASGGGPPPRPAPEPGPVRPAPPARARRATVDAPARSVPPPAPAPRPRRRRLLPRRPKLRRVLLLGSLLLPLLLLALVVGGWLYARSVFDKIEKIPVAEVLSDGGEGTNYLIVGSDSRDPAALEEAGLNPDAFRDGGGQRSDTMLLLRFADGGAQLMSIPRDLFVPIAETGGSAKINSAYNGGPRRLILTVQQSLGIPVHQYLEVDFVSFASLVDALGGVTIDFPHPAFDRRSGLDVQTAGPVELDGPQALAYVRSREYVEVVDGRNRPDPTADLGRVVRQQQFLTAVLGELAESRNPLTLARAASDAADGLRVDDSLGLLDAIRLGWRLRGLDPEPVVLPVENGRNRAGAVLFLVQPDAEQVLARFR